MSNLSEVISKLKEQTYNNPIYKPAGQLVEQRKQQLALRLPGLDNAALHCLAIFLQAADTSRFTDEELIIIAESGLETLEYSGEVTKIAKVIRPENPSFDVAGIVLNDEIEYAAIRKSYRRALASHKSLNPEFQAMYLSNL